MRQAYPLSPAQRYHWNLTRRGEYAPDINIVLALFIPGHALMPGIEKRIEMAVARHAVLRTIIAGSPDDPSQIFDDSVAIPVRWIDVDPAVAETQRTNAAFEAWFDRRAISNPCRAAILDTMAIEKAYRYELAFEPPTRIALVPDSDSSVAVILGFHHAATDAFSLSLIVRDVIEALSADFSSMPLDLRYLHYAVEKDAAYRQHRDRQTDYWTRLLADDAKYGAKSLLLRRPRPCRMQQRVIPKYEDDAAGVPRAGISPQILHMMALAYAVQRSGLPDSYILGSTANRVTPEEQQVVGCFYRHIVWNPPRLQEVNLAQTSAAMAIQGLRSYQNIDVSLSDIIEAAFHRVGAYPRLDASVIFRDMRSLDFGHGPDAKIEVIPFLSHEIEDRIPIHLHVSIEDDHSSANMTYDPEFIDNDVASRLADAVVEFYSFNHRTAGGA